MTSFTVIPKPEVLPLIASGWQMKNACMGTLFQKVSCRLLVADIGKAVPVHVQARNMTYASPEHAAVDKTVVKQTGQCTFITSK